ncbi:MAG: 23S rRNA (adenine(2030)-N(6))-methyltransferase RlmJ [Dokdonella sp.]
MNYRHAFHAGNFADVFKHALLVELLAMLQAKPAAICYVDTHAGRGHYDLHGDEAERTREYVDGVQRLVDARNLPSLLGQYVALVRSFGSNTRGALLQYPGSPAIAALLMRDYDRGILCELHEEEAAALRIALRGDTRFAIHQRDGYAAMNALLPPAQKRGLVLIDPPFEAQGGEYVHIQNALDNGLARWPNATYAIWYPIKLRETVIPFHRWLASHAGAHAVLVTELLLHADNSALRLNGCGIAIINPPWQLELRLHQWLPALGQLLKGKRDATWRIDELGH